MKKTKFNTEQQHAIDSFTNIDNPKSVFVSASAGTGKTTMITHAYLKLLEQDIVPSEIVAITFTNNATNEMFMRIRSLVRSRIYESTSEDDKKRWSNIYNQLGKEANISTIDKFASKIIKKYSYRLDLLPNINIIGDNDEQNIQTIKNVIENVFQNNAMYEKIYTDMQLYIQYNKDNFIANIIKFINDIKPSVGNFDNLDKQIKDLIKVDLDKLDKSVYDNIKMSINHIWQYEHSGTTIVKAKDILEVHKDNIFDFETLVKLSQANTTDSKLALKKCLESSIVLMSIKLGKLADLKETTEALTNELLPTYYDIVFKLYYKDYILNFVDFLREVYEAYEMQKINSNSLTFNDLISKTIELLEDNNIGNKIRDAIKYLIVDETQDTNDLQYSLVNYLLFGNKDIDTNNLEQSKKVAFIVGDRKQSIYRFRNANIDSFLDLEKIFTNGNRSESIYLNKNYRSDEHLIKFFNSIFSEIFTDDEIKYSNDDNLIALKLDDTTTIDKNIEYLVLEHNNSESQKISASEKHLLEAHAVARHIREKLNENGNLSYDQFAILLPVFSNLHNYIEALTKYEIPFYISSGKGFFNRLEIANVVNFLKYLVLKENDLLPLILNETFFDITENELYIINRILLEHDLKLKYLFIQDQSDLLNIFDELIELKTKIISIREIIFSLFDYAHFENASTIINAIIKKTKYNAYLMTTNEAEFAYSNIEKFIEIAYQHEREQSGNNIYTFIESINNLSNADEKYATVPLLKVNAVTIMSIHASKGLEFENVVVGALSNYPLPNYNKKELAFVGQYAHIPIYTEQGDVIELCNVSKDFDNSKRLAERRRVLYVALTRAKKSLTLVGEKPEKRNNSYRSIIEDYYKVSNGGYSFLEHTKDESLKNNTNIKIHIYDKTILDIIPNDKKEASSKIDASNINITNKQSYHSPKKIVLRASHQKNNIDNKPPVIFHNIKNLLESKIAQYGDDDCYIEEIAYIDNNNSEDNSNKEIMALGTLVHEILEIFNHKQYKNLGDKYIQILIDNAKTKLAQYSDKLDAIQKITKALNTYIKNPHIQNVLDENSSEELFMREHSFEKRVKDQYGNINIIRSKIDLVTYDEKSETYYIIDYKLSSGKYTKHKETYENQMATYKEAMCGFLGVDEKHIQTELMYLLAQ